MTTRRPLPTQAWMARRHRLRADWLEPFQIPRLRLPEPAHRALLLAALARLWTRPARTLKYPSSHDGQPIGTSSPARPATSPAPGPWWRRPGTWRQPRISRHLAVITRSDLPQLDFGLPHM